MVASKETASPRPFEESPPQSSDSERARREERILDAAATLLVRWGYRKTTIDDVAREAGVGKGTIYLHWKDKNALFRSAILHVQQQAGEDIMQRIADDPQGGLFHRMWTHAMLAALSYPLLATIMKGRTEIFQGLAGTFDATTINQLSGNYEEYIIQLQRAGLIRADIPVSIIVFLTSALKIGAITTPDILGPEHTPPLEQLTEEVSEMLRRWLTPEQLPSDTTAGKRALAEWLEKAKEVENAEE
jgi:AcrR family transcriptional regulator